jgi:riboflavin kinase / FMN adenylyltransferase
MNVARSATELAVCPRAVAIGTFDGVHLGHRSVVRAAVDAGGGALRPTVVTFHPHPRTVLGKRVELLATLERRLELLEAAGVRDVLVVEFRPEIAALEPQDFARQYLLGIGAQMVVAGTGFHFGKGRAGDLELLRGLGLDAREVPLVEGVSSTRIRQLAHAGDVEGAARLLGRPV